MQTGTVAMPAASQGAQQECLRYIQKQAQFLDIFKNAKTRGMPKDWLRVAFDKLHPAILAGCNNNEESRKQSMEKKWVV
ncbi:hypothetical protein RY831_05755 [Noviherbaspirillum sp. CPCC 100848]|uniref:Uncharacterized protein n=1 Tax=Noviherbaspirillum album TaxID=3080276 RepID=A0ABU6J4V5_9BURK|nr:hypothetical protein [Noviherbaspirillum sp. CPCC 100848]MEC4718644.1 hypothetical protein [Noviherbaspirillum sp. CPCC 100848]